MILSHTEIPSRTECLLKMANGISTKARSSGDESSVLLQRSAAARRKLSRNSLNAIDLPSRARASNDSRSRRLSSKAVEELAADPRLSKPRDQSMKSKKCWILTYLGNHHRPKMDDQPEDYPHIYIPVEMYTAQ